MSKLKLNFLVTVFILSVFYFPQAQLPAEQVLEVFDFPTTEAARSEWIPVAGSQSVELFEGISGSEKHGVRFPCNFDTVTDRCYWDYAFSADLSSDDIFTLRVYVEDPAPISSLTLYFRSPGGWFANTIPVPEKGWQTLRLTRAGFHESSTPAGWDQITGIRFSLWKGSSENTSIIATELRLYTPSIKIIKGSHTSSPGTAEQTASLIAECLDAWSIDYGMTTDDDVDAESLADIKLVILPYNSNQPAAEITALKDFLNDGGKLIAFYLLDPELAGLLGMKSQGIKSHDVRAMNFVPGMMECMPSRIEQNSWNINAMIPDNTATKILAYWEDAAGITLDRAAWLMNPKGAFMTHVLLDDDLERKKQMMLSIVAHYVPEVIEEAMSSAIEKIMPVGHYDDFNEAVNGILSEATLTPRLDIVQDEVASAIEHRSLALDFMTSETFCRTLDFATSSHQHLLEAYSLAQRPEVPEFRALWESAGTGVFPGEWDKSASLLQSNGFNAIIPIMFTGGMARYDSKILPHASEYIDYGDQVAQCVEGCHQHGIEVHVRRINWFLLWTEQNFIDQMRAEGRTQVDVNGNPGDWLCPSDPRNQQFELDCIMEVVTNYNIDGISYDFIRYPGPTWCYCDSCRDRFTSDTGHVVQNWPDDCYNGSLKEEYREWRREQITRLVRDAHSAIKSVKPHVKISAAVFSSYPYCRDSVGQDWVYWTEQGYVDFVCPMNYTDSLNTFRNLVSNQMDYVAGQKPLYPGIGVNSSSYKVPPDQVIAQIRVTRENDTGGFVLFNLVPSVAGNHLPVLGRGITRPIQNNCRWLWY